MNLSEHFTLEELTASQTASRKGIPNTPTTEVADNLKALCENILEPIRKLAGHPITISSGFRSPRVNKAVGGSATSQHCFGEAADINCPAIGQQALFNLIKESGLPFDQLIDEFKSWVHVSFSRSRKRGQVLKARRVKGKTTYTPVR